MRNFDLDLAYFLLLKGYKYKGIPIQRNIYVDDQHPWCPEWGSNPHWEDFKSSASAIGLSGPREGTSVLGL